MHVVFIQQSDELEFAEESRASNNTVIPNQSSDWCGNLHRIPGSLSSYRLFYSAVFRNSSTSNCASIREIATPVTSVTGSQWPGSRARNDRKIDSPTNSNFPNCCVQPIRTTFFLSIPHPSFFFRDGIIKQVCLSITNCIYQKIHRSIITPPGHHFPLAFFPRMMYNTQYIPITTLF